MVGCPKLKSKYKSTNIYKRKIYQKSENRALYNKSLDYSPFIQMCIEQLNMFAQRNAWKEILLEQF